MRIGFDAKRIYQNPTGLGNASRNMLHALFDAYPDESYVLFTPCTKSPILFPVPSNVRLIEHHGICKACWRSAGIRRDLEKEHIDLYHGLSNEIPFTIKRTGIRSVVMIHDLIFLRYPEQYPLIDRNIYRIKSAYACRNADVIIAASKATKEDICSYYHISPEKIHVVYQCCDAHFLHPDLAKMPSGLPPEYVLYVGSLIERKNLMGILNAYTMLSESLRIPLVIVGKGNRYAKKAMHFATHNGLAKYCIFRNDIRNDQLPAIYAGASAFLYPSLFEGFGIPVLEALSAGAPVITSSTSSLPEVGGEAALYVDPENPADIAHALQSVLEDSALRETMRAKGKSQIAAYSPRHMADSLMEIYKKCI